MQKSFKETSLERRTYQKNLSNKLLKNIWGQEYRNQYLLFEMLKRGFISKKKVNAGVCKKCGEVLVSVSVHDFCGCKCESFVDGGTDCSYMRVGGEVGKATKKEILNFLSK